MISQRWCQRQQGGEPGKRCGVGNGVRSEFRLLILSAIWGWKSARDLSVRGGLAGCFTFVTVPGGGFHAANLPPQDSTWHLWVFRYDPVSGAHGILHRHALVMASTPLPHGVWATSKGYILVNTSANTFSVYAMDEIGYWQGALSNASLGALWNGGAGITWPAVDGWL